MNKIVKKTGALLITSLLLFFESAYATPLYTYTETTPVTNTINLTKVNSFYSDHNISYTLIEADLTDKNVKLNLLTPNSGIDTFDTVSNLAKTDENTIAAVNGDFFSVQKGNKGFSLGLEIKDGKLLQSPIYPGTMATVYLADDKLNMEYIDFHIMAVAPNGQYNEIRHLNKHTEYYGDILMYTSHFNGGFSPAPGGEVVEVVVENNIITEFRRNMPPVEISENGYVLVVSEGANMFFSNNFAVGDEIKLDYYMPSELLESNTAFGGGSLLVNEGKALTSFSHVVTGYNPRTAIGTDKTGKKLYLVTVDGRQSSSRGMSMQELANLMEEIGCYTAVNLDGGGSTNMVASTVYDKNLTTANSPTQNRAVSNAVSLSHNAETDKITGVLIKCDKDVVFIGEEVNITAATHDKYLRPTSDDVVLSSLQGEFNENVFIPKKSGIATIKAKSGKKSATAKIYVIDKISGIKLKDHIHLENGESTLLDIEVFDENGKSAKIINTELFEISSSDEEIVSVLGQTVTAHKDGTAIITVKKDNAISYVSVTVGSEKYIYTDDFENPKGVFTMYPKSAKGSFEKSDKYALSGNFSGKLSFDFTEEDNETKAVYYNLLKQQTLYRLEDKISLGVYTENDFNHTLKAQLTDANGRIFRIAFEEKIENEAWNTVSVTVPSDAARPVTLDKIYVVYTDGEEKDEGVIYLDDLVFTASNDYKFEIAPDNVYDIDNTYKKSSSVFKVGALSNDAPTLFTKAIDKKTTKTVSDVSSYALLGNVNTFSTVEDDDAIYINVDTSKGGIRKTSGTQWNMLADAINSTDKDNVFILSSNSIFADDEFENKVLKDYLAACQKNVFVICGGSEYTYANFDGVSYFSLINTENNAISTERIENYRYLEFSFGNYVTFKWKNLYE